MTNFRPITATLVEQQDALRRGPDWSDRGWWQQVGVEVRTNAATKIGKEIVRQLEGEQR